MNFLELCNRIKRKCRITGAAMTSVSTTQAEEFARVVDWANEAWMIIQRKRPDWKWMRQNMTFPTVAGQATYTLAQIQSTGTNFSNFGHWELDTFRNYPTATGQSAEMLMKDPMPYNTWLDIYQYGTNRTTQQRPSEFTVIPGNGIGLGPTPAAGYTITGDYFKVPTEMSVIADEPGMPAEFHMAIVYRAMMLYGVSESAPAIHDEGAASFKAIMAELESHQLPTLEEPGALA